MDVLYKRCAGLDIHKKTVVACRLETLADGHKVQEVQTFGTMTADLLRLLDWLQSWACTHAAMESTGDYWRPVYNLLEGHLEVLLVNAQHVKQVPGRKTDVGDAEWLADLLRHGLLRGSFVPPRPQRELRDLVRQRSNLVAERADVVNRLQKVLEDANIKLGSVVSNVSGVSARAMLEALVAGERDVSALADLAYGAMRKKRAELERALTGRLRPHHGFLVTQHLIHLDFLDEQIALFSAEIAQRMEPPPAEPPVEAPPPSGSQALAPSQMLSYSAALALLDTIPGVNRRVAEVILVEIGTDMTRFATPRHLAAWAGLAPGNYRSAGKRLSGRILPGNRSLRQALVQAAHAAARKANCYLAAQYHRLAARRGKKRAIVAVAHSIVVIVHHLLTRHESYRELGGNYFDERKREAVVNRLVHRLEKLGYQVALEQEPRPASVAAS